MNRGADSQKSKSGGYTIVEVLIFLAVSGVLFVSTMLMLAGRQQRAQFTNAVRDFETKLTDVANDVANGYYQSGTNNNISCTQGPTVIYDSAVNVEQGKHDECIFLGRLVKLGDSSPVAEGYGVYSIVGNRQTPGDVNVSTLVQANPTLLWTGNEPTNTGLREEKQFGFGTSVACVGVNTNRCDPANNDNAGVAFISKVTGNVEVGRSGSGIRAELHVFGGIQVSESPPFTADINETSAVESAAICLLSGSTNQYALIHLGNAGGSGLTVTSEVKEGRTCGI